MPANLLPIAQILTLLAEAPPRIAALTADLSHAQLQRAPSPGEWSANGVLAHLRGCADVWGNYIALIISEEMPAIRAISPRTWIRKTDYPNQEFQPSLHAYTTQRAQLLAMLEGLAPDAWTRSALVTAVGKPSIGTVHTYAERLALHEQEHIRQIEEIARQWTSSNG